MTKFSPELREGLTKPLTGFVPRMLFGIQSGQDVKLSNIARSPREEIAPIRTGKRLSRNLKSTGLEKEPAPRFVRMGSQRVQPNTVPALDLSGIRKEYAQKMEHLALVRGGGTGELHRGYWLRGVTGADVNGSEIVPLYRKPFPAEAKDFSSENAEIPAAADPIRTHTQGRGIWTIDRGGGRKKLLEPLLDRGERFVIRSTGKRTAIDRHKLQGSVAEAAGRRRLGHHARILKIQDGHEKVCDPHYGAGPIPLPDRSGQLWLVVVAGFGEAPLMLPANLPVAAKDSQSLWWIVQIYLTRWKIEETFRFIKQSYRLEDIRVMKYRRLQNLVMLVTAAAYFAATFPGQQLKPRILCEKLSIISRRFFGIPPFRFYAPADGIRRILSQGAFSPPKMPPASLQMELTLSWEG